MKNMKNHINDIIMIYIRISFFGLNKFQKNFFFISRTRKITKLIFLNSIFNFRFSLRNSCNNL